MSWEQTFRDVLVILAVAIASGRAGWWAHATNEERRMKRMVARAKWGIKEAEERPQFMHPSAEHQR